MPTEMKENINEVIAHQIQITGKRKQLLEELQRLDMNVANIFESAINVLQVNNIHNRINLSAHALREVIAKLPESTNIPKIKQSASLGNLMKNFMACWSKFNKGYNWSAINHWTSEGQLIIRKILQKCEVLVVASDKILITKDSKYKNKLKKLLEHSNLESVPLRKEQELIECLKQCNDYFSAVAHHAPTELETFIEKLNQLEYVVLSIIMQTPFTNREELLELINKAEGR